MDQQIKNIIGLIDRTSSEFADRIPSAEKRLLDEISLLLKKLEVRGNKIVPSTANLKLVTRIKTKLGRAVLSRDFKHEISDFIKGFSAVGSAQADYFSSFSGFRPKALHKQMQTMAAENTIDALAGSGLQSGVIRPISEMLLRCVTSGMKYTDAVSQVEKALTGAPGKGGLFASYAKTYATTALSQFSRQYSQLVSDGLGLEWFMYVGSKKTTTREFCEYLLKKKWVHRSEFKDLLTGKIDGHQCEINDKTGLPKGMVEGTDESTLQANCGGWNCQHELVPVDASQVPFALREKIRLKNDPAALGA